MSFSPAVTKQTDVPAKATTTTAATTLRTTTTAAVVKQILSINIY